MVNVLECSKINVHVQLARGLRRIENYDASSLQILCNVV